MKYGLFCVLLFFPFLGNAKEGHNHGHLHDNPKDLHQWNLDQKKILRDLWIESLPKTTINHRNNAVVNNEAARQFGHKLFFDARLSANGKISCAHCHQPKYFFSDGRQKAFGLAAVSRNTPSIVGSVYSQWQFHDGRSDSLWSQALIPLENENEHGGNRLFFAKVIYNNPDLKAQYERLFGSLPNLTDTKRFPNIDGNVSAKHFKETWNDLDKSDKHVIDAIFTNLGKAIAAYEAKLVPAPSRVDHYIEAVLNDAHNNSAKHLSDQETLGLKLFIGKAMCIMCHNGPLFSNFEMHNIGTLTRSDKQFDWGRFEGARSVLDYEFNCRSEFNDDKDKSCKELEFIKLNKKHTVGSFKTPSIRNVSKTPPYMHDGRFNSLRQVIAHYNSPPKNPIGKLDNMIISLSENEVDALIAFLRSLDSQINSDKKWLAAPKTKGTTQK